MNRAGFPRSSAAYHASESINGRGTQLFGPYRARVESVDDPEKRGRLRVRVLLIHPEPKGAAKAGKTPLDGMYMEDLPWAERCTPDGGDRVGDFHIPYKIGECGWVMFENGDPDYPIWIGSSYAAPKDKKNEVPDQVVVEGRDEEYAHRRIIKTRRGHNIQLADTQDNLEIIIEDAKGNRIHLDTQRDVLRIQWNGDVEEYVTGSKRVYIGGDLEETIKGDRKIAVDGKSHELIKDEEVRRIEKASLTHYLDAQAVIVDKDCLLQVSTLTTAADKGVVLQISDGALTEKISGNRTEDIGGAWTVKAGNIILNGSTVIVTGSSLLCSPPWVLGGGEAPSVADAETIESTDPTAPNDPNKNAPDGRALSDYPKSPNPPIWDPKPPFAPPIDDQKDFDYYGPEDYPEDEPVVKRQGQG